MKLIKHSYRKFGHITQMHPSSSFFRVGGLGMVLHGVGSGGNLGMKACGVGGCDLGMGACDADGCGLGMGAHGADGDICSTFCCLLTSLVLFSSLK